MKQNLILNKNSPNSKLNFCFDSLPYDKSCPVSIQPLFASSSGSNDSSTNSSKYDFSFSLRDTFRNGVAYSAWNLYLTQLLTLNPGRLCVVAALSQQVEAWRSGGIQIHIWLPLDPAVTQNLGLSLQNLEKTILSDVPFLNVEYTVVHLN